MFLIFDTETTGIPKNGFNPHIVELAAMLVNEDLEEQGSINVLIKPEGWTIPEEAAKVTGITTADCEKSGVPLYLAMEMFAAMFDRGDGQITTLVAHNIQFDFDMLLRSGLYHKYPHLKERPQYCTKEKSENICRIPPTPRMKAAGYGHKFKAPNLAEAFRHFYGKDFQGAHRALQDVKACRAVFSALRRLGVN